MTEEQKFTSAFSAAIAEAEKKSEPGKKLGSRIIQVATREEHERQAQTMSAFIVALTREFMDEF